MRIRGVTRNVVVLGWVSFFTDLASEIFYPVMPLFLVGTLGASPALLGLINGIAEGGSNVLRWLAGAISDRFRRRKPFVAAGYTISALSKPLMALPPRWAAGRCSCWAASPTASASRSARRHATP